MNDPSGKALVVVVAKEPVAGKVKTRLTPGISPDDAAGLYRCFILDRIRGIGSLTGVDRAVAYTPADAVGTFSALPLDGFELFPQCGADLGERLNNIFLDKLSNGYQAVSIVDSDSPDLPNSLIRESVQLLLSRQAEVVFGPCHDGGYYLVGMRNPHPELFRDIPWSTGSVLSTSLEKCRALGLDVNLLSSWNDLDTFDDLLQFYDRYKERPVFDNGGGAEAFGFLSRLEKVGGRKRSGVRRTSSK
jgi:rSAM/selenodomain-associated transferase 1